MAMTVSSSVEAVSELHEKTYVVEAAGVNSYQTLKVRLLNVVALLAMQEGKGGSFVVVAPVTFVNSRVTCGSGPDGGMASAVRQLSFGGGGTWAGAGLVARRPTASASAAARARPAKDAGARLLSPATMHVVFMISIRLGLETSYSTLENGRWRISLEAHGPQRVTRDRERGDSARKDVTTEAVRLVANNFGQRV
jgi:hypothetical protein